VPHPMLFILPDYAVTRLAKFAPDFWAWRSGVFQFQTMPKTRDDALKFLEPKMVDRHYDRPVIPERIEILERLLMEYQPSGRAIASDNLGTCGDILHQLGVAYLSQDNPGKANGYLVNALKLAEQREDLSLQARVKSDLGEAYLRQKEYERAIAYAQQALKIQEQLNDLQGKAESLKIQGRAYRLLGLHEEAIGSVDQSIQLNPDSYHAWYFRGAALYESERYEEAITSFDQSIHLNPDSQDTWFFRGIALDNLGHYEEAITSFDQSIQIEPNNYLTWGSRGNALRSLERYEEAIASYQKSLEISQQTGDRNQEAVSLFNLAKTFSKLDRNQEAIQFYQSAMQLLQAIGLEEKVQDCDEAIASLEPSNGSHVSLNFPNAASGNELSISG